MDPWMWWLVIAGVFALAETQTASLHLIMLSGGAAAASAAAALGMPPAVQLSVFAVVSALLILLVRPIAINHRRVPPEVRTGVAALVGADAVVLEQVDGDDGRVKLAGEVWSARAYDGHSVIPVGERVQVIEISGATALVA